MTRLAEHPMLLLRPIIPAREIRGAKGIIMGSRAVEKAENADREAPSAKRPVLDRETFSRFRAGEPDAMETLVLLYHRRLIGFIRLFTQNRDMAEELTQEVFLTAYQHRTDVQDPEKLHPWLFTLARRKAVREMKKKRYSLEAAVDDETLRAAAPTEDPIQGNGILNEQLMAALREALEVLKDSDREILTLRYFGGLQMKEIADVLNMPMGSVGVTISRALKKVRTIMELKGLNSGDFI